VAKTPEMQFLQELGIADDRGRIGELERRALIEAFGRKRQAARPTPEDLLDSGAVRFMCGGIAPMTLYRWQDDPELKFPAADVVIQRRRFWRRATVERWLDRQEARGVAATKTSSPRGKQFIESEPTPATRRSHREPPRPGQTPHRARRKAPVPANKRASDAASAPASTR
jgi:hypothetical protein